MKIIKDVDQKSDEWKKLRLGRFGSTDAQSVSANGKGLVTICYQKVGELVTGKLPESYTNAHMERGNEYEDMARSAYEIETGNLVTQVGYFDFDEFTGGSPDGLVGDDGLVKLNVLVMLTLLNIYTKKRLTLNICGRCNT